MTAQSGTGSRRVWLDRLAFVEISLTVDVLEKPPQGLDITVVIRDIRIVHIHPITDTLGKGPPLRGVFHHLFTAGTVVVLHADFLADVFLGNTEFFLYAKLYRQSMCVPSRPSAHFVSGLCLVPAHCILDGSGHHMMYTRHAVG